MLIKNSHILITVGAGFIGSYTPKDLAAERAAVCDNSSPVSLQNLINFDGNIEIIDGD